MRPEPAELLLMVGLPGAGKTTRATQLAATHRALRLTPDEWMVSLFDGSQPDGKRDLLEGRLIALALQALQLGTNVVLDFGLWGRDERSALRWLATSVGASCHVVYLPIDKDVQRARIAHRQATAPHTTFPMSEADIDAWRKQFQAPDATELPARPRGGQAGRSGPRTDGPRLHTAAPPRRGGDIGPRHAVPGNSVASTGVVLVGCPGWTDTRCSPPSMSSYAGVRSLIRWTDGSSTPGR